MLTGITDKVLGFLEKQLEEKVEFFVPLQTNDEDDHFIVYPDNKNINDLGEKELKKLKELGLVANNETGTSHELLHFLGYEIVKITNKKDGGGA